MNSRESGAGRGAQGGGPAQQGPNLPPLILPGSSEEWKLHFKRPPSWRGGREGGEQCPSRCFQCQGLPEPREAGRGRHTRARGACSKLAMGSEDPSGVCRDPERSASHPSADRDPPGGPVLQGFGLTQESRKSFCDSLTGQDTSLQRRKGPVPLTLEDGDKGLDRHWGPLRQSIPLSSLPPALSRRGLNPKSG